MERGRASRVCTGLLFESAMGYKQGEDTGGVRRPARAHAQLLGLQSLMLHPFRHDGVGKAQPMCPVLAVPSQRMHTCGVTQVCMYVRCQRSPHLNANHAVAGFQPLSDTATVFGCGPLLQASPWTRSQPTHQPSSLDPASGNADHTHSPVPAMLPAPSPPLNVPLTTLTPTSHSDSQVPPWIRCQPSIGHPCVASPTQICTPSPTTRSRASAL